MIFNSHRITIRELLMILAYHSPHVIKFEQKQLRMEIAKEMLTIFNDDPDLLKKSLLVTNHGSTGMTLKPKSIIPFCYDWGDKSKIEIIAELKETLA